MKTIARFVGVAMVLGLVAGAVAPAQAATVAELQAMIAQLQAQLSSLSGNTTTTTSTTFTTDLTVGSSGAQVKALQDILISKGYLAAGLNTGYFGGLTQAAVAKWQASAGITPAAGYVGPKSRAALNALSTAPGQTGGNTSTGGSLSGGDGDFADFEVMSNPSSEEVQEGEAEAVFGFEFEAEDSDLRVERVNLVFSSTSRPWDSFAKVNLLMGDKEVASVDADSKSDWDEEGDDYTISFGDLSAVVKEGQTAKFYVEVEAQDSIDSSDLGEWTVGLGDEISEDGDATDASESSDAIRAENAEGVNIYAGDDEVKTFEITTISTDINVTVNSDDNEDDTVEVDEDNGEDDVTIYTASFESEEGDNTITELEVDLSTSTGVANGLEEIVSTLYLFIDGKEVASESVNTTSNMGSTTVRFEDFDVTVDEDEEAEIVIKADINPGEDFTTGDSIFVDSVRITSEDINGDETETNVTTNGGVITLGSEGVMVALNGTPSATKDTVVAGEPDAGTYTIKFKVTAFGDDDVYVLKNTTEDNDGTYAATAGIVYSVSNDASNTTSATLASNADEETNSYRVEAGQTEEFTLTVFVTAGDTLVAGSSATARVALEAVTWATTDTTTGTVVTAGIDEKFRTGDLNLTNR